MSATLSPLIILLSWFKYNCYCIWSKDGVRPMLPITNKHKYCRHQCNCSRLL